MRDNFKLFVVKVNSEDEKLIWLGKNLEKLPGSGILYTGTRVDTEIYSKWFEHLKISSTGYNAGLDADSRIAIENGLMNNQWKCIISTNALGMGIDKPDIRFIIHTQIPQSPIHYYQEIGRAGRDGQNSYIILFYNPEDKRLPEAFIEGGRPSINKYNKVIAAVKAEFLGERDLMRRTNLKQNQIRVIKTDLIEQRIIREIVIGKSKKYEFVPNSQPLNTKAFEDLRNAKTKDLDSMIQYVETTESRMKFLCDYLGDTSNHTFTNCDNTGEKKIVVQVTPEWTEKLKNFREDYFPELEVESSGSHIVNGVASSYYGVSNVGSAIHHCKYEGGGDFPDFLLKLVLKAFRKKFGQEKFDLIVYVPQTSSGDLVKNFATKISQVLKFPISHNLKKTRTTAQQKVFENSYLKSDNVKGAFTYTVPNEIQGRSILLIDDIFDSGATVKEAGRTLSNFGATKIAPIVIARTVGGDLASKESTSFKSSTLGATYSMDGRSICLMDSELEKAVIYKVNSRGLLRLKELKGFGTFLSNDVLILFYSYSGYGYFNTDSYLYDIVNHKTQSLFCNSYEELIDYSKHKGFPDSFFVLRSAGFITTVEHLILKDDFGGIYFYKISDILTALQFDYCYVTEDESTNKIQTLLSYDEKTNTFQYCNLEGIIDNLTISFTKKLDKKKNIDGLNFNNAWYCGSSMDYHTLSSHLNKDGSFTTIRTELGELLFQCKYRNDKSKILELGRRVENYLNTGVEKIDVLIPIPPSNTARLFQPIIEISKQISQDSKIPTDINYLKKRTSEQLKKIDNNNRRKEILKNSFFVDDARYKGKNILLLDDLFRSGETLNVAAKVLIEKGEVENIYALTITMTKAKR